MKKALEFVDSISLNAAATDFYLTNGLPNDYLYWGLLLRAEWRLVVGTAGLSTVMYGAPTTFLERISVEGTLAGRGRVTVVDMSGRQIWQYTRAMWAIAPFVDPDDFVRAAGAIGTYDMRVEYVIPFCALGSPRMERATLLPGNRFSNPLTLRIRRGGTGALGILAGTSTTTYTDYGVGTGNPTLYVSRIIVKEGYGSPMRTGLFCQKVRQGPFTSVATSGTDALIGRLNTGNLIGRLFLLTGTAETGANQSGELASGSNTILSNFRLRRNNDMLRTFRFIDEHHFGAWLRGVDLYGVATMNSQVPTGQTNGTNLGERVGEALLDFCPDGNLDDSLNTVPWQARGENLFMYGDITGAANQQLEVISEEYSPLD